jgi:hypothetical protein
MRREPDYFQGQELPLLFIARKLRHALDVERLLTAAGLDYLVETDLFSSGVIFRSERVGAFFYVAAGQLEAARDTLQRAGFSVITSQTLRRQE